MHITHSTERTITVCGLFCPKFLTKYILPDLLSQFLKVKPSHNLKFIKILQFFLSISKILFKICVTYMLQKYYPRVLYKFKFKISANCFQIKNNFFVNYIVQHTFAHMKKTYIYIRNIRRTVGKNRKNTVIISQLLKYHSDQLKLY